jgi:hypothetical protein
MYRKSKSRSPRRRSPIRKSRRRKRSKSKKPCKPDQRRSKRTGRCAKYVRVINKSKTETQCKKRLSDKIRINMEEMEAGRFSSRRQAVAVSYSQINKKYPGCKKYFSRY